MKQKESELDPLVVAIFTGVIFVLVSAVIFGGYALGIFAFKLSDWQTEKVIELKNVICYDEKVGSFVEPLPACRECR